MLFLITAAHLHTDLCATVEEKENRCADSSKVFIRTRSLQKRSPCYFKGSVFGLAADQSKAEAQYSA